MHRGFSSLRQRFNAHHLIVFLPLIAIILLEAHIRFLSLKLHFISDYLLINAQLFLQCTPFLVAHVCASRFTLKRAVIVFSFGFIVYPILFLILKEQFANTAQWHFLDLQSWALCLSVSLVWLISKRGNKSKKILNSKWLKSIVSLDGMLFMMMFGWSLIFSGVLNTHVNPMLNQPFNIIIDITKIFSEFDNFVNYLWQITLYTALMYSVYLLNRYILIRKILTHCGVLAFLSASLIGLVILTPTLTSWVLLLPINDLPVGISNLTPGGNNNIFSPDNYLFMFFYLAVSTPIILAFERQQQHAQINEIAQQQTTTELKLLQQQINPHFLFNTLNNLYALTLTKSDDAPELVMQLANLLRYSVYEGQKSQVSLTNEVDYLKDFIALQRIRSGERCQFETQWPEQAQQYAIAPLLLIMILENAIKHGVEPTSDKVTVVFKLTITENTLTLFSANPINHAQTSSHQGVGLTNLRRRLALLYPNKHTLTINENNDLWQTTLAMELPRC
ncbi:sensor histidine kinase [Pseudoalteromonas sp. NEC-BIFX-2020_015]|uniref:sensor histidine kinase n=1 Tax=Pseudoalteromonas sp. NEC-BIFX-2020_015 TaxID=2729544 RepID=UPI0014613354|nr:sensor histidine kinase [Pseudoalteromonas sp. NEC-BIFX-2020_015]NMR27971.1 sensor histidine kinase [Pseudoalteromonas sp. NEC-BIFX-2020_015]